MQAQPQAAPATSTTSAADAAKGLIDGVEKKKKSCTV